jgi:hypothetical protein
LECFLVGWHAFARVGIAFYRDGMLSSEFEYLCTWLKCFPEGCHASYWVGMLSSELEYLCTGMKCFLDSIMLSTGLGCFLHGWNAFDRVGIPLYRVEMFSRLLECFPEGGNAIYRVGMLSRGLQCSLEA